MLESYRQIKNARKHKGFYGFDVFCANYQQVRKEEDMALLDRIANYFKEWDGIDETAPKMELSIHDLRYIADMNVERCRLIRQLNEANLKTKEIRNRAIDEFAEELKKEISFKYSSGQINHAYRAKEKTLKIIDELAERMKGGAE